MRTYQKEQIRSIDFDTKNGEIVLFVKPMLESAYYLAGANVTETDSRLVLQLIRCEISENCDTELESEVTPGGDNPYKISLPYPSKPLYIEYGDGEQELIASP